MFKTVKSKILLITVVMLAFLMFAFACHTVLSRMKTMQLMVQNYGFSINSFLNETNNRITKSEDNLKSLALIGSLFYVTDRSTDLTNRVVTRIFENYPESLGGGIWFKPYILDKSKKYVCFYAYRNKNNKVILDKSFASEEYDYPNQDWYKQIISQVTPKRNIIWSKPYYENQGSRTMMMTAGTGIYANNELVGIATVDWDIDSVIAEVSKMKPLEKTFSMYKSGNEIKNSFALFGNINYDYVIATTDPYLDSNALVGHSLKEIPWYRDNLYEITYITYHDKKYVPFVRKMKNGMVLIICIPKSEMFKDINKFYSYIVFVMLLIGLIIPMLLYFSMNHYIINPIGKLINIAQKISKGEDIKIKIENPEEFAQLACTFDKMTGAIKDITKEREKIVAELDIAKSIQLSSLPNDFPPFPDKSEFSIYASMEPAKEVGGDFYDFYFVDRNDNFMFLIADVSGKGIPAALFMMTAKTLTNNMAQIGYSPKELIRLINNKICENNKQGFFVTMLVGIVDIKTGKLTLINCGHNQPLIKRQNGNYEYIEMDSNTPLGIFEDTDFSIYETQLNKGDLIFTYTDGITEAMNENDEMYGEQRLCDTLNDIKDVDNVEEILLKVKQDLKTYTNQAPQSDDITMLGFKYQGSATQESDNIKMYDDLAIIENYKAFHTWLHNNLEEWQINENLSYILDMCSEEIFANITFYAYSESKGNVKAFCQNTNTEIILKFEDTGMAYNPLEKPDPDITLPPEQRPIGGLGIYMVKKMAKNVLYERDENKNILTLIFDK